MENAAAIAPELMGNFLERIRQDLPDTRDIRGRRHTLEFPLVAIVVAMLSRCQTTSSIQRFMVERLAWLQELTGMASAQVLSRSYLDVFLNRIDWPSLAVLVRQYFGVALGYAGWVAIDGKVLRGSSKGEMREATVLAVTHGSALEVASAPQSGPKSSEVPVVRKLLVEADLAKGKVSMDALHCNPETLGLIAQAQGVYLTQVKGNQPELLAQCSALALLEPALASMATCEKSHGKLAVRVHQLFALRPGMLHDRWTPCKPQYLVSVLREVMNYKTQGSSVEQSYYITNSPPTTDRAGQLKELATAVREHWSVESNNWVRDVTLGEDHVQTKARTQSQVMATLRGVTLTLLRKVGATNLQALTERFCYTPATLAGWLRSVKFL